MKSLHVGDLHVGVKNDDPWLQEIIRKAIKGAVEYSKENDIKVWFQYGDWFDVRKAITHTTMEFSRELVEMIAAAGIHVYVNVGNHDMHYKNKIHPNACTELLSSYDNITVIDKPTTLDLGDNLSVDVIPWMCEENTKEILDFIKTSSSEYCIGHWELNGFWFYRGLKSHGIEPDFLRKYSQVWSGHFHTISEAGNVKYIGTPYTITAGDENDPRGVWEFDSATQKLEFLENEKTWHKRIEYPGVINYDDYKDCAVRLIVTEVDAKLAETESNLEKVVHELRVVSKIEHSELQTGDTEVEIKNVLTLMEEHIKGLDEPDETIQTLLKKVKSLYIEAQNE